MNYPNGNEISQIAIEISQIAIEIPQLNTDIITQYYWNHHKIKSYFAMIQTELHKSLGILVEAPPTVSHEQFNVSDVGQIIIYRRL